MRPEGQMAADHWAGGAGRNGRESDGSGVVGFRRREGRAGGRRARWQLGGEEAG